MKRLRYQSVSSRRRTPGVHIELLLVIVVLATAIMMFLSLTSHQHPRTSTPKSLPKIDQNKSNPITHIVPAG